MKKRLGGLLLLAALGGCSTGGGGGGPQGNNFMSHVGPGGNATACGPQGCSQMPYQARAVPGVMDGFGSPIAAPPGGTMTSPLATLPRAGNLNSAQTAARSSFAQSLPPQIASQILQKDDARKNIGLLASGIGPGSPFLQTGGTMAADGMVLRAGGPGVGTDGGIQRMSGPPMAGPGPAGLSGPVPPLGSGLPGAVAAIGAIKDGAPPFAASRTSIRFSGPSGMKVQWYVPGADGKPELLAQALETPGRYNFLQAAIYRLKLSNIPGRPGLELYPTLEVVPANNRTSTFLAHSSVPLTFTQEDFDQVAAGNYLVKVVYLPNPQFQDLAIAGPNEIVSSRLEPGADPIAEALQRGSILLVVRLGNIDLEAPNTPAIDAPGPFKPMPPGFGVGMPPGMGGPAMGLPPGLGMPPGGPGMGMPNMAGPVPGMMGPGPRGLPSGGPMIPGMFPPPPPGGAMRPPMPGAPPGAPGPVSSRSMDAATQTGGAEEQEPPEKKKPSSWMPSWFDKKSK